MLRASIYEIDYRDRSIAFLWTDRGRLLMLEDLREFLDSRQPDNTLHFNSIQELRIAARTVEGKSQKQIMVPVELFGSSVWAVRVDRLSWLLYELALEWGHPEALEFLHELASDRLKAIAQGDL